MSPKIRTALRQEYFQDTDGARTGFGSMLRLWSTTLTADYRIWKGLEVRLEYRHDSADEKVFKARTSRPDQSIGVTPQSKTLDTSTCSYALRPACFLAWERPEETSPPS